MHLAAAARTERTVAASPKLSVAPTVAPASVPAVTQIDPPDPPPLWADVPPPSAEIDPSSVSVPETARRMAPPPAPE